jgi:hypothetical protein
MEKIKEEKEAVYHYLRGIPAASWSQYAFPAPWFGHIISNIAESINSTWDDIYHMPVLQLLLAAWDQVITTIYQRHHQKHQSNRITNYAWLQLQKGYNQARHYAISSAKRRLAKVNISNGPSYIMDLHGKEWSYNKFQEFLIPCCYAIAICLSQAEDPYDYIDDWYSLEYYRLTYSRHITPIREKDLVGEWSESKAPILAKQQGRPKKKRFRQGEGSKKLIFCGHCEQKGHNRRSCRSTIAVRQ